MEAAQPVLLFDGVCNLCCSSVQFVLKRNSQENIRFASLQSAFGQRALQNANLPNDYADSLVLLEEGKIFVKSDAALRLSKHLDGIWKFAQVFRFVPAFVRNSVYDLVARHRYRWFGKQKVCWLPDPKWKSRFLG
jgi:predicted DCC family thiol-disulfide oxidoreductase YuxK